MREYLEQAIASFDNDPPSTDFQRGYLAALKNTLHDLEKQGVL